MNKALKDLKRECREVGRVTSGVSAKGVMPTIGYSGPLSGGVFSGSANFELPPGTYTLGLLQEQEKIFFTIDNTLERVRTVLKRIYPPCTAFLMCSEEPTIQDTNTSPEDTYQISTGFLIAYFKLERKLSNRKFQDVLSTFAIADIRTMALLLLADKYFGKNLLVAMQFVNKLEEIVGNYRTANFEFYYVVNAYYKAYREEKLTTTLFRKMLGVK